MFYPTAEEAKRIADAGTPGTYSKTPCVTGNQVDGFTVTNVYTPEPVPPITVKTGGDNEDEVAGNADPFFTKAVDADPGFPPNAESKDFTFVLAAQGDAPAPSTPMVTVTITERVPNTRLTLVISSSRLTILAMQTRRPLPTSLLSNKKAAGSLTRQRVVWTLRLRLRVKTMARFRCPTRRKTS